MHDTSKGIHSSETIISRKDFDVFIGNLLSDDCVMQKKHHREHRKNLNKPYQLVPLLFHYIWGEITENASVKLCGFMITILHLLNVRINVKVKSS
jgi:hypothetical protein